jgi:predicted metal-dependent phosphoesterase TrpH
MTELSRVECHCHTRYSKDCLTSLDRLLQACERKKIDRLIITDHNQIQGAQEAFKMDPKRVVVGEEIMTQAGELLAFFVQEEIPAGLPPLEAIRRLRQQNAFISVSHPYDQLRRGHWEPDDLLRIAPLVDAIETFNARCIWWPPFNHQAQDFARQHNLAGTAGSDAHSVYEVGRATLLLPHFNNADDLREVIRSAQFRVSGLAAGEMAKKEAEAPRGTAKQPHKKNPLLTKPPLCVQLTSPWGDGGTRQTQGT